MRDHRGSAVAAIGIGGFVSDLPDERLPELAGHVLSEAQKITDALGGALGALAPPRLDITVLGAVEPPVPPVARTDTPSGRRSVRQSRPSPKS